MILERDLSIFKLKKEGVQNLLNTKKKRIKELQKEIAVRTYQIRDLEIQVMINEVGMTFIDDSIKGLKVNIHEDSLG